MKKVFRHVKALNCYRAFFCIFRRATVVETQLFLYLVLSFVPENAFLKHYSHHMKPLIILRVLLYGLVLSVKTLLPIQ